MDKHIFISFSSKDQAKADELVDFLENKGYNCFISSRDLVAGKEYAGQLIENIACSGALVLLLSGASNESPHVLREVESAVSKKIPIIVYALEEVTLSKSMDYYLMTHQWVPIGGNQKARLLKGLGNIDSGSEIAFSAGESVASTKRKSRLPMAAIIAAVCLLIAVVVIIVIVRKPADSDKNAGEVQLTENKPSVTSEAKNDETAATTERDNGAADTQVIGTEAADENTVAAGTEPTDTEMVVTGTEPADADAVTPAEKKEVKEKEPGEIVSFGSYLEAPVEWIIIGADEDSYKLVSKYILSMKCFDAAEGKEYGFYEDVDYTLFENHIITDPELTTKVRGNNDWSKSNIRTWLNSDRGIVEYSDQAPCEKAVRANPYDFEAGFLHGFCAEEKAAMKAAEITTTVNCLNEEASDGKITTVDYVYLLSSEELELFKEIDMHIYAKPTKEAVEQDKNKEGYRSFSVEYDTENYYYWLRDNDPEDYVNKAYAAVMEGCGDIQYISDSVGACSYGVRPVINVKKSYFCE
ncbi:MAG: toll/interleukin-1 receptor domain-containing protein [Lachnospiraceae bacterium]|nr:toll/interleukin-1 receptor domain-containing protein [Lachnospiraceae bacterium]